MNSTTRILCIGVLAWGSLTQAHAQSFTWLSGTKTSQALPTYTTGGTASKTNSPGARILPAFLHDSNDNIWLWGGYKGTSGIGDRFADLWHYSPSSQEWRWVSGPQGSSISSTFGTINITDSSNKLGSRVCNAAWVANNGNLFFFGGEGEDDNGDIGKMNDMWEYDVATNRWTWVSGSKLRNQPTVSAGLNISDPTNIPGARQYSSYWKDSSGNFWLFGGTGIDSTSNSGELNDLWKFNPTTKTWVMVSGTTFADQVGVYGTQFLSAPGNYPGGRASSGFTVAPDGTFWLHGGRGYDSSSYKGTLNDLWKFNPSTSQWTWMAGNPTQTDDLQKPRLGTPEQFLSTNNPSGRSNSALYFDKDNILNLLGGVGFDNSLSTYNNNLLGDMWKYDTTLNQWAYIKGSLSGTGAPAYGVQGIPSVNNNPGITGGAGIVSLNDKSVLLYGGINISYLQIPLVIDAMDNLWKITVPNIDIIGSIASTQIKYSNNPKKGETTGVKITGTIKDAADKGIPATLASAYIVNSNTEIPTGAPLSIFNVKAIKEPKPGKTAKPGKLAVTISVPGKITGKYLAIKLNAFELADEKKLSNNYLYVGPITN